MGSVQLEDFVQRHPLSHPGATRTPIPNPGGRQYSSSVTPDGTVYFARSSGACGEGVRLMRHPLDGDSVLITRIQSGDVDLNGAYWEWGGTTLTWEQWQSLGHDLNGALRLTT